MSRHERGEPRTEPDDLEARVGELEAAIRALEAYVGHVERIDDDLERRANAALAGIEDLEARVRSLEGRRSQPAADPATSPSTAAEPIVATPEDEAPTPAPESTTDDGGEPGLLERLRMEL